jgi:hypothetical protein
MDLQYTQDRRASHFISAGIVLTAFSLTFSREGLVKTNDNKKKSVCLSALRNQYMSAMRTMFCLFSKCFSQVDMLGSDEFHVSDMAQPAQ